MRIPSCIISPAISLAINPTAENYKEKISRKIALLKREKQNVGKSKFKILAGIFITTSNAVFVSTSNIFNLAFNYTISTTI